MSDDREMLLDRVAELTLRLVRAEAALGPHAPITVDSLPAAIAAVVAERDQLRARITAYGDELTGWEEMRLLIKESSLGKPEAQALIDRTPQEVGRAIVLGSHYLARAEEAEAERDRLRAVVRDTWAALWHADPSEVELISPAHGAMLPGVVGATMLAAVEHNNELEAERDRLRAVVTAALEVVRPMADSACDADVLRIADLYRILAGPALDGSAEATDG